MFVFNLFHSVLVLLEQADIISNKSKSAIFINDSLGFQKGGGGNYVQWYSRGKKLFFTSV